MMGIPRGGGKFGPYYFDALAEIEAVRENDPVCKAEKERWLAEQKVKDEEMEMKRKENEKMVPEVEEEQKRQNEVLKREWEEQEWEMKAKTSKPTQDRAKKTLRKRGAAASPKSKPDEMEQQCSFEVPQGMEFSGFSPSTDQSEATEKPMYNIGTPVPMFGQSS